MATLMRDHMLLNLGARSARGRRTSRHVRWLR
jgi:hypothetical protein